MRALLAAILALAVLLAAEAPHVHAPADGGLECALCTVRHAAPASTTLPDVVPRVLAEGDAPTDPALPPVSGAPLGAVPGQSPPDLA